MKYILNAEKNEDLKYATAINTSTDYKVAYENFKELFEKYDCEKFSSPDKSGKKQHIRIHSYIQSFDEDGNHLVHHALYNSYRKLAEKLGLKAKRFYDLRHTYATISLQSGDNIKTVQKNLGHATPSFTMQVYGHVTDEMKKQSASKWDNYIDNIKAV